MLTPTGGRTVQWEHTQIPTSPTTHNNNNITGATHTHRWSHLLRTSANTSVTWKIVFGSDSSRVSISLLEATKARNKFACSPATTEVFRAKPYRHWTQRTVSPRSSTKELSPIDVWPSFTCWRSKQAHSNVCFHHTNSLGYLSEIFKVPLWFLKWFSRVYKYRCLLFIPPILSSTVAVRHEYKRSCDPANKEYRLGKCQGNEKVLYSLREHLSHLAY